MPIQRFPASRRGSLAANALAAVPVIDAPGARAGPGRAGPAPGDGIGPSPALALQWHDLVTPEDLVTPGGSGDDRRAVVTAGDCGDGQHVHLPAWCPRTSRADSI